MSNPISELDQIAFELEEWIRQPDWAEKFTLQDMVDWASDKRPIHIVQKLRQISARQGAPELTEGDRATDEDWRDDPAADERWQAGCDFALVQLCHALDVDPKAVRWDAATETLDGDVIAVIWNIIASFLRVKMGDDWDPDASVTVAQTSPEPEVPNKLPCDVHLPPHTVIGNGAIKQRKTWEDEHTRLPKPMRPLAQTEDYRRCQMCNSPTKGEEAYINGEYWCHPCADAAPAPSTE